MNNWFLDVYRASDKLVLWIKSQYGNIRLEQDFTAHFYVHSAAEELLKRLKVDYAITDGFTYLKSWKKVCCIPVKDISSFERFVAWLEAKARHKLPIYNADIAPEQQFLYERGLAPGMAIDNNLKPVGGPEIALTKAVISLKMSKGKVISITINGSCIEGSEQDILLRFLGLFTAIDPDVIVMDYAFSLIPVLEQKLLDYGLTPPFHRWDKEQIIYRGGKSFFSYGQVIFRDYAIRLHGRFLVDSCTTMGGECDIEGILELCRLSGARFQHVASRSFGATFQFSLMRLMYQKGYLVPYKEKPVDIPLSARDLLKGDAAGHRLDPKVGFHRDVAEIDFSSMFPWIIYNKNISADTMLCNDPPLQKVPGIALTVSHSRRGLIPAAIKPFLDRRMQYKANPTALNLGRAKALKYVLVTAYGYLRFREFKLGIASSQMAICAYAREILLQAAGLAESQGYEVVHGIVDSLFIHKKGITEADASQFCKQLEALVGIPASLEGIFKWIVFLPSINDPYRPLPATYYGAFANCSVKARGIEVRQRRSPLLVKQYQQAVLDQMAKCSTKAEIIAKAGSFCRLISTVLSQDIPAKALIHYIRISQASYKRNIPQKAILDKLKARGITALPGHYIEYICQQGRIVLPDEYSGKPDIGHYRKLLERSLFNLLQPLGISRQMISELSGSERQSCITDFLHIKQVLVPFSKESDRLGLSERIIRKRLEAAGWTVWRGELLNVIKHDDIYPNVRRKYELLARLLDELHPGKREQLEYICAVHHGIPDFICCRQSKFKFVECKLGYELLGIGQRKTIAILHELGFEVEVHRLAEPQTSARLQQLNIKNGRKIMLERQVKLAV